MQKINFDIKWLEFISINSNWDKEFDICNIPPIKRRRLSDCAKSVFSLTNKLKIDMPVIFSSNSGEINRCFDLLSDLKNGVSPTSFSLSVLNAIPAMLSIEKQNHNEILAISSTASLQYAILNAVAKEKALVLSYFEGANKDYYKDQPFNILIAMIIEKGEKYSLSWELSSGKKEISELVFLQNYGKKSFVCHDGYTKWHWNENN